MQRQTWEGRGHTSMLIFAAVLRVAELAVQLLPALPQQKPGTSPCDHRVLQLAEAAVRGM